MKQSLGILGGLGPLASAEFLKTIYEFNMTDLEQQSPVCILYSDPTFPDRTDAILNGADDVLVSLLVESLERLFHLGVSKVVIVCVTMHYFLPKVPAPCREKIISLIDLIVKEVLATDQKYLLLCTNGTRKAGIFQKHEQWHLIEKYVLLPDDDDQNMLQNFIYEIKLNSNHHHLLNYLNTLVHKYNIDSLIAGCTEFHILNKTLMKCSHKSQNYQMIDPLVTISKNLNHFMI